MSRSFVPLVPVVLFGLAASAHAQTFITADTTLDSSNPVAGNAVVGYANYADLTNGTNKFSPTVNLVTGGSIGLSLSTFNNSTFNLAGGSIGTPGIVGEIFSRDNSTVNAMGNSILSILDAFDSSTANVAGGTFKDGIVAYANTLVNVTGGSFGHYLESTNDSTLNITGGLSKGSLTADENSHATVSGGSFGQDQGVNLFVMHSAILTLIGNNITITDIGYYCPTPMRVKLA